MLTTTRRLMLNGNLRTTGRSSISIAFDISNGISSNTSVFPNETTPELENDPLKRILFFQLSVFWGCKRAFFLLGTFFLVGIYVYMIYASHRKPNYRRAHWTIVPTFRTLKKFSTLGGSSQVSQVVRITPTFISHEWPFGRGPTTLLKGDLRSPCLLTTYVRPGMILPVGSSRIDHDNIDILVGGFNPSEKYARQNGFIFPK